MTTRVMQPGDELLDLIRGEFEDASETVVLAALVTNGGVQSILGSIKTALARNSRIEFIFGTGMPASSSPSAIEKLFQLHDNDRFKLLWYKGGPFFHPKLFLFRKLNKFSLLVGSSNFTEGGFKDNIEFNCYTDDLKLQDQAIREISEALARIRLDTAEIDSKWIETYAKRCAKIRTGQRRLARESLSLSAQLNRRRTVQLGRWNQIVRAAIEFRQTPAYQERLSNIPNYIHNCRQTIGASNKPNVVVERWRHKSKLGLFGTMDSRQFSKTIPRTKSDLAHLNESLRHLLDHKEPISTRLRDVLSLRLKYHVPGLGISMASDILNKYYPSECIIYNAPIVKALQSFGVRHLPSDPVEAYLRVAGIYKSLKREAKYPKDNGYALLDQFMWIKGHKLIYGWA